MYMYVYKIAAHFLEHWNLDKSSLAQQAEQTPMKPCVAEEKAHGKLVGPTVDGSEIRPTSWAW